MGGAFPNHLPQQPLCHSWLRTICGRGDWGGGGCRAKDGHKRARTQAYPPHTSPNANSFALAKRLCGHYLRTKVLEAGGLCITALSVSTTCLASAGRVAELSFCHVCRSQREHNGPHRPGSGMAFFLTPVPPALFTSTISRTPERSIRRWLGAQGGGGGGKYRSLA